MSISSMPCILWRGSGAQHDVFCIIGACCANFRGPQATSIKMDLFLFCSCKTLSETYQTFSTRYTETDTLLYNNFTLKSQRNTPQG
jgi:hypothetical protein